MRAQSIRCESKQSRDRRRVQLVDHSVGKHSVESSKFRSFVSSKLDDMEHPTVAMSFLGSPYVPLVRVNADVSDVCRQVIQNVAGATTYVQNAVTWLHRERFYHQGVAPSSGNDSSKPTVHRCGGERFPEVKTGHVELDEDG